MIYASVIIPTFNRSKYLAMTMDSLVRQSYPESNYEVIIVDNNSTDNTAAIAQHYVSRCGNIRYVKEPRQGLHNGRHRGAIEAKGDILVYIDDDVICDKSWLSELVKCYEDPQVVCAGGKILPKWEAQPPAWMAQYTGYLSLLDHGEGIITLDKPELNGCNFSIRKSLLYKYGGFHPDGFPDALIWFRGDGETGLLLKLIADRVKIVYSSKALVWHIIPASRLTLDYIRKRSFNEGISNAFTEHHCKRYSMPRSVKKALVLSFPYYSTYRLMSVIYKLLNDDRWIKYDIRCSYLKSHIIYEIKLLKDAGFRDYLQTKSWL